MNRINPSSKFLSYNDIYNQIKSYGFQEIKDKFLFILQTEKRSTCASIIDGFINVIYDFETQKNKSSIEQLEFAIGYSCLYDLYIALSDIKNITVSNADTLFVFIHIIIGKARYNIQLGKIIIHILKVVNPNLFLRNYEPPEWTLIEKNKLLDEISQNVSIETIAINHYRPVQDIKIKLKFIAYDLFVNDKLSINEIMKMTSVSIDTMNEIVRMSHLGRIKE